MDGQEKSRAEENEIIKTVHVRSRSPSHFGPMLALSPSDPQIREPDGHVALHHSDSVPLKDPQNRHLPGDPHSGVEAHLARHDVTYEWAQGMVDLMVDSTLPLLKSWESIIERGGGIGDVRVDQDLRSFSADVISKACFGSSYRKGKEIFLRLRALQDFLSKPGLSIGVSSTKKNKEIWRLEREVELSIMKMIVERKEPWKRKGSVAGSGGVRREELWCGQSSEPVFGWTTARTSTLLAMNHNSSAATWALMLLALNPEWQARARDEIRLRCGAHLPNADSIRQMKTRHCVYTLQPHLCQEALQEMKFGDIHIPKGHQHLGAQFQNCIKIPAFGGQMPHEFNPARFANGIVGACKLPHVYIAIRPRAPHLFGPELCHDRTEGPALSCAV
ncbi:cytochrome P450 714B3 isoform X1 [Cinnamomum micranthum f. kanehirae]|uniref:Cytochrome P450 714B3 isoform X1 n=1 Tax=Cinnamomum micranthum f. kanehirae TaxID=337451 RepID=A0A443NPU7_9MAGN|nr:cytochrome P450 714B3 isoform X1 [Cinnamomum micranthum f. kanehirae]